MGSLVANMKPKPESRRWVASPVGIKTRPPDQSLFFILSPRGDSIHPYSLVAGYGDGIALTN